MICKFADVATLITCVLPYAVHFKIMCLSDKFVSFEVLKWENRNAEILMPLLNY